jgi:coenzyme F420 hydrogenase subunit delta
LFVESDPKVAEVGECLPDFCRVGTVVMGCGNRLLGDDGFGPAVISYLQEHGGTPNDAAILDAGTGISRILFDMALAPSRPKTLIVIDAMKLGLPAGTVSCMSLDSFQSEHSKVFSEHQEPTSCLLKELRDMRGIKVILLVAEPGFTPEEVSPGLSPAMLEAVREAGDLVRSGLSADQEQANNRRA